MMDTDLEDVLRDSIQDAYSEGDGELKPQRLVDALAKYGYEIRKTDVPDDDDILVSSPVGEFCFSHVGVGLIKTCEACPEQYDAYYQGKTVGYLRLRHGIFRVYYPDVSSDEIVYRTSTMGDGCFIDCERAEHLKRACILLKARQKTGHNEDNRGVDGHFGSGQ